MGLLDNVVNSVLTSVKNAVSGKINETANSMANSAANAINDAVSQGVKALLNATKKETVTFKSLPKTDEELKSLDCFDLKDPEKVAALAVAAFCEYKENKSACIAMLNVLKGPSPLTNQDISFINDRFMDGKTYVPFSYFNGAAVENGYKPSEPYQMTVYTLEHSRDQEEEGYLLLYVQSAGADSPRGIKLRKKASTGEWFLWDFKGILTDIRVPVSEDPWA